ncbi:MAG: hypothetical protein ACMUEM_05005 [Flavobacteriales bacterium AspAUS03]
MLLLGTGRVFECTGLRYIANDSELEFKDLKGGGQVSTQHDTLPVEKVKTISKNCSQLLKISPNI